MWASHAIFVSIITMALGQQVNSRMNGIGLSSVIRILEMGGAINNTRGIIHQDKIIVIIGS